MSSNPDTAVVAYTDGSALGNPGPGGYGVVLRMEDNSKELSGGYARTTNNRMELLAVIKALEALQRPCTVAVYSDSKYVIDALRQGWLANWQKNGWKTAGKKAVKNQDLWQQLLPLTAQHSCTWHWVKGHHGNPDNERCDTLAKEAASANRLPPDRGYII